jgi:sigma-B regulation protein RsbU (phosphoserine phosphatase)
MPPLTAAPIVKPGLSIATFELDASHRIIGCDPAFYELFACTGAAVLGKPLVELVSPRDSRGLAELIERTQRGAAIDLVLCFHVAGRDHLSRLRVQRTTNGWKGFVEPVSGNDDLVFRLVGVEHRWNELFHASADGVVVLDETGHIVEFNEAFHRMIVLRQSRGAALTGTELPGRKLVELLGTELPGFGEFLAKPEGEFAARTGAGVTCLEVKARSIELANHARAGTFVLMREAAGDTAEIEARDAINRTDLARARAFQRIILSAPPTIPDYDVGLVYRPLDVVGGDLYDIAVLPAGRVRVFIADSTGHGIAAALVTMLLKSAYDSVKYTLGGPSAVLEALNDRVAMDYKGFDTMFTGLVLDLALDTNEIDYSTAGHPPPIVVENGVVRELKTGGTVLGVAAYKTFPSWSVKLAPGSSVYLITDGLTEARNAQNEYYGDARLHAAIATADALEIGAGDSVVTQLEAWLRPAAPNDDITLIALRPNRVPSPSAS